MPSLRQRTHGFTLIELMVAVAIVGILAMLGIPFLYRATMKARMAEVPPMLAALRSNEISYFGTGDMFVAAPPTPDDAPGPAVRAFVEAAPYPLESIGFRPEGTYRYSYLVNINPAANAFSIGAKGDLDADGVFQYWGYQYPNSANLPAPSPWGQTIMEEKQPVQISPLSVY